MYCFMKEEQCEGGAPSVVRRLHAYLDFAGQLLNPSPQSAAVDRSWIHGSLNFCLNHSTCGPSKVPTACLTEYNTVQYSTCVNIVACVHLSMSHVAWEHGSSITRNGPYRAIGTSLSRPGTVQAWTPPWVPRIYCSAVDHRVRTQCFSQGRAPNNTSYII